MKTIWPAFRFSGLLIAGAALTALPAIAQVSREAATTVQAPSTSISSVEVAEIGQRIAVRISGNQELHYQASRLDSPPRLVLDFADTRVTASKNSVPSEYAPVRQVRLGQPTPDKSRVVIDLAAFAPYSVEADGSNLTVSFNAPSAASGAIVLAAFRPARVKTVERKQTPLRVPDMPLPVWLTGRNLAFASPASEPRPPVPQAQTPPAPTAQQGPAAVAPDQKYTGDPISVNLKDVDLKDFFRLIHEISGLNVVLDPSVKGTVTLVLDEVPWDQALDIVLRNNGLTKEIDGNVLRIATQDTLKHEADERLALAKSESDAIPTVTVTRVINYAKADLLRVTLKPFLSPRGNIFADVRTNSLLISDIPDSLPKIDNLLRQLDRKSQQVEIDARVVSATRSFARDIGTQFGFSTTAGNTGLGGLVGPEGVLSPIIHNGIAPPFSVSSGGGSSIPLSSNLGGTAPNSGISFSTQGANYAVDFILSAMENKGVGKVMSEPKGITQNNEKLTVKQGTQIPVQTTVNNTISVQFVDAVLKLEVTPQITSDGTVFLDINVENTSVDNGIPLVNGVPALQTQSTQTKVLINDGGTVVIGGVVLNNQQTTINQVPLLGSVPLIGQLFKHTSISVSSQELLFFVTPRILPG